MTQTTQDLVAAAREQVTEIEPAEARKRIEAGAVPLDVRDDHEFDAGHVPDAVHITRGMLEFQVGDNPATRDPDTELVVYCRAGGRAALAARTLQGLGYTNVVSIEGGYDGWVAAGEAVAAPAADEEE